MNQPPVNRKPGRPRTEDVQARSEAQPVKVVTIETTGIQCPGCQRSVQPKITKTVKLTRYANCPNCQVQLRIDYDDAWKPLRIQVLW